MPARSQAAPQGANETRRKRFRDVNLVYSRERVVLLWNSRGHGFGFRRVERVRRLLFRKREAESLNGFVGKRASGAPWCPN